MPTIEELKTRVQAVGAEYQDVRQRVAELQERLDPAGTLHLKAEALAEPEAIAERDQVRAELEAAERRASELYHQHTGACEDVQRAESRQRRAADGRMREAIAYTRQLEQDYTEELARLGWFLQTNGDVRREYEGAALDYMRRFHGEPAAEHCRRVVLPALLGDSSLYMGAADAGLQRPSLNRMSTGGAA